MYVCGITPYDATHLGHAATYLTFDLINRYLRLQKREVSFVENITDIDDPLLLRAERDSVDWKSLATSQIELYAGDMAALRIIPPSHFESVTESMDLIITAIATVIQKGFTYSLDGDIYFKSKTFLAQLPIPYDQAVAEFAERGGDPARVGKEEPLDPVLWLANKPGEPGWNAPFGFGRPGWHVECCAIALRYLLGPNYLVDEIARDFCIDLQGGGSDLIFPHHFMSAVLGSVLTGKPFAAGYLHTGMVGLDGEKMSKSKGNLVFVSKLIASGVDPMVIRYALMQEKYSADRMWADIVLATATSKVENLRSALARMEVANTTSVIEGIIAALANDLDTPKALALLDDWANETRSVRSVRSAGSIGSTSSTISMDRLGSAGELSRALDSLLGLAL
jgi:L-cysteine:1D-myo-inositol 2-amino-2-deoxy-alpha-D-glucopyranoside ligase